MMTTQTETNNKAPTHTIYLVEAKEGSKSEWHKVGAAWEHNDKEGMSLAINTLGIAYLKSSGSDTTLTVRRNKQQE